MSPEEKLQQKIDDVQWVMETEQGRRFVWDLLAFCGVYRALEGEPNQMLVQEGQRRVGLHLLGITTEASEDHVFMMMLEAKNRTIEEMNHVKRSQPDTDRRTEDYDSTLGGEHYSGPGGFI
jgi:hypothetical protein